jgi:hypothetical protein
MMDHSDKRRFRRFGKMPRTFKYGIWFFVALVLSGIFLSIIWFRLERPYFFAFLALAAFYWISVLVTGSADPLHIVMGADGRLSTSKFQFFVWTGVIVFVYVLLFGSLDKDHLEILSRIPANVLLVMGFSVTTAVGAKGITVSYLNAGQIAKPASGQAGGDTSLSGLVTHDDSNTPDLTKLQMLIWTAIATVVYLCHVHQALPGIIACKIAANPADALCKFPDIDQSLMVLMGLSQGAYLGNKLVSVGSPQLTGLSPSVGVPGTDITISGQSLGPSQNGAIILINGQDARISATSWADSAVHFTLPLKRLDGTLWIPEEKVTIAVVMNGQQTANLPFAFVPNPVITNVSPGNPSKASQVTISGRNFGTKQPGSKLFLNNSDNTSLVSLWTDSQLQFAFQNTLPGGAAWQPNVNVAIQVAVSDDFKSAPQNVTSA